MRADSPSHKSGLAPIVSDFANEPEMRELVELFVEELPNRVNAMREALSRSDLEVLRRSAHQLKGAGGGYGFGSISASAGRLESVLAASLRASNEDAQAIENVRIQLDELIQLCGRVRTE